MKCFYAGLVLLCATSVSQSDKQHHIQGATQPLGQPKEVHRADTRNGSPIAPMRLGTVRIANYHLKFGTVFPAGHKLAGRYFYRGWNHRHWSSYGFYPAYGCNLYLCPYTNTWYYWCSPDFCYYPVSYVPYNSYVVNVDANVDRSIEEPANQLGPPPPVVPSQPPFRPQPIPLDLVPIPSNVA